MYLGGGYIRARPSLRGRTTYCVDKGEMSHNVHVAEKKFVYLLLFHHVITRHLLSDPHLV